MTALRNDSPLVTSARHLRAMIEGGTWLPGERLPAEARLAAETGVSRFTVHRALEGLADEGFLEHVGKRGWRVLQRAAEGALAGTIGIIGRDFDLASAITRGTQAQHLVVFGGVLEALHEAGLEALAIHADRALGDGIASLRRAGLAGVIVLLDCSDEAELRAWSQAQAADGLRVAIHSDDPPPPGCRAVTSDHRAGGAAVLRWLHAQGCRRPLRIEERVPGLRRPARWWQQRNAGLEVASRELGLPLLPAQGLLVPQPTLGQDGPEGFEIKVRLAEHLLRPVFESDPAPDALIAMADRNTGYLSAALRRLGREPGRDVRIAGYDAAWPYCIEQRFESCPPSVTVDKREVEIGRRLVAALETGSPDVVELVAPAIVEY